MTTESSIISSINSNFIYADVSFDRKLIQSLTLSGPRYTSYPTADRFQDQYTTLDYAHALIHERKPDKPLSLYVHIPFCDTVCFYCACNKIVTKDYSKAQRYLNYLFREIDQIVSIMERQVPVVQLHFGGGTPLFLSDVQIDALMTKLKTCFQFSDTGEYSIEVDPRGITPQRIAHLSRLGFNRISIGVQDFDPQVQQAINRVQTEQETLAVIQAARQYGFRSASVDLIYGLPLQSVESMERTLDQVLSMSPDRFAVYNYAHLPTHFLPQRRIDSSQMPSAEQKLDILQRVVQKLLAAGYVFIGMDHFAKPDDELSLALKEGRLHRNFQGYSTHAGCDLIGLGVSSIGSIGTHYVQNEKELDQYYASLDAGRLPVKRGYVLSPDDVLRRRIIQMLMCQFRLDKTAIETEFGIQFKDYFSTELHDLAKLQQLGLLAEGGDCLYVLPKGRFLIRNIAVIFDRYLREQSTHRVYSKTI